MRKITYYSNMNSNLYLESKILFHVLNSRKTYAKLDSFLNFKNCSLGLFARQLDIKQRGLI